MLHYFNLKWNLLFYLLRIHAQSGFSHSQYSLTPFFCAILFSHFKINALHELRKETIKSSHNLIYNITITSTSHNIDMRINLHIHQIHYTKLFCQMETFCGITMKRLNQTLQKHL